jgi:hypothetical protein
MSMSQTARPFQFVGISPYVDQAAEALTLKDERMKGKARNIEHLARIQTALGQAMQVAPDDRSAVFAQALAFRESLAAALLAAELAIRDVAEALALDTPSFDELVLELASVHAGGKTA